LGVANSLNVLCSAIFSKTSSLSPLKLLFEGVKVGYPLVFFPSYLLLQSSQPLDKKLVHLYKSS